MVMVALWITQILAQIIEPENGGIILMIAVLCHLINANNANQKQ